MTGTSGTTASSPWYSSELFSTVLSGVILAVFGYALTGRLEQSVKERELNTTNAKEMQELLVKLDTGSAAEAEAAAISLTTFGSYAIPPLIANLQYGPERALAAERGLVTLALTDSADVCDRLQAVIDNRTQRYTAQSHTSVIRILGDVPCGSRQVPALQRYEEFLKKADVDSVGMRAYQEAVRNGTPSNVTDSRHELARTLRILDAGHAR